MRHGPTSEGWSGGLDKLMMRRKSKVEFKATESPRLRFQR